MPTPIQIAQAIQVQQMQQIAAAQAAQAIARGDTAGAQAVLGYAQTAAQSAATTSAALALRDRATNKGGLFSSSNLLKTGATVGAGVATGGGSFLPSLFGSFGESLTGLFSGANIGDALSKVTGSIKTPGFDTGGVKSAIQSAGNAAGEVISAPVKAVTGAAYFGGPVALSAAGAIGGIAGAANSLLNTGKGILQAFTGGGAPVSGGTTDGGVSTSNMSPLGFSGGGATSGASEAAPLASGPSPSGPNTALIVGAIAALAVGAYFLTRK